MKKNIKLIVIMIYLRRHRPWWRHPRWHIHHWKLQVPFIQSLQRWLFTRCAGCGRRFKFGASNVVSTQWDSDGPRWFRGEKHLYHFECVPAPLQPKP